MVLRFEDIKNVLILGSGVLGLRVGLQAAISGYSTTIYDIDKRAIEKAQFVHQKILRRLISTGKISQEEAEVVNKRISWTTDSARAALDVDFVSESVTEDIELKRKVWAQFGNLCPEHTIFTTNTSYLLPSHFANETGRPERFCAFHFHDVFKANVVDIMPHPNTEKWIPDLLYQVGLKLNQTPVIIKNETPGYLFNTMLMAVLGAAARLIVNKTATIQDVDRSWMGNFNTQSGPFGILDSIGLDTALHVVKYNKDGSDGRIAGLLKTYINRGKLGVKSGEGFYKYPNPEFLKEGFLE